MMDDIEQLPNLGPASASWLRSVGIRCRGDLERIGPVGAFVMVREAGHRPSLNLLWAMAAGLLGRPWTGLSPEEKRLLSRELAEFGEP
jgi:hypothetical protein